MKDFCSNNHLLCLHTHSVYSMLDGVSTIDEYISYTKKIGGPALGLTDHGWVIGALELYEKCKKAGITPLPGCEFYLAPPADYPFAGKSYDYFHLTVWSYNEKGYRNLIKLGSMSWNQDLIQGQRYDRKLQKNISGEFSRVVKKWNNEKPRITFEELFQYNEGLVIGSGCLIGAISKGHMSREEKGAQENLGKLLEVFRGRFYMEILPHNCSENWDRKLQKFVHNECNDFTPDGDLQKACNLRNIKIARDNNIPLLMTLDSHFVSSEQKKLQDVILGNSETGGWTFANSYHALSTADAWDFWSYTYGDDEENRKLFQESIENQYKIVDLAKDIKIASEYRQPPVEIPQDIQTAIPNESQQLKALLMRKIEQHGRMDWNDPAQRARLKRELDIICDNGKIDFAKYFLFLEHWMSWARSMSILQGVGRGSAGGSFLSYLLKITHLNPLKYDLPFERFLSHGRINREKYPDHDLDIGQREIFIEKLKETYPGRFAQCSTHHMLKVKSALKDACRSLLGWASTDPRVDSVSKTIDKEPMGVSSRDFLLGYKEKDGTVHRGHLEQNKVLRKFFDDYPQVYEMVLQLLGIPRTVSRHACFDKDTLVDSNGIVSKICVARFSGIKPIRTWSTGERETLLVSLNNGISIACTPDHVFITPDGEVQAENLLGKEVNFKAFSSVTGFEAIDLEACFALGWALNDGTFTKDRPNQVLYFTPRKDDEPKARILKYMTSLGVCQWKDKSRRDQYYVGREGLPDYFFAARKNKEQRLPDYFWRLTDECQRMFLRGFFSANGFVLSTKPRVGFKVCSRLLASDICHWLLAKGIDVSARYVAPGFSRCYGREIKSNGNVEVNIAYRESKRKFLATIGFEQSYKTNRLKKICASDGCENQPKKKIKCLAIEPFGIREVYDFNEPQENSGYISGILVHNSAFFICEVPISEIVPTCVVGGEVCTQYVASGENFAEKSGLIKFDFLRINTLDDIGKCIRLVQRSAGYRVWYEKVVVNGKEFEVSRGDLEIDQLPLKDGRIVSVYELPDDLDVYQDLCDGKTEALFQVSTPGMTAFCRRVKPTSIASISDIVALDRPGPLDAEIEPGITFAEAYIMRRAGKMPVTYVHPDMEPILKNTYGVFVYQEQLQRAFSDLARYSAEQADYFREVLAKKKKQEMEKYLPEIRQKLADRGWTEEQVEVFIGACVAASAYSFNCIDGDQMVNTTNGLVRMSEIANNPKDYRLYSVSSAGELCIETPSFGKLMGEKEVIEVILDDGSVIRATEDHRFLTKEGWFSLKHIMQNDLEFDVKCQK